MKRCTVEHLTFAR